MLSWLFARRRLRPQAYQRGIMRRYLREGGAWQSHLRSTQAAMLHFARRHCTSGLSVLGSGWLLDVPTEYLLRVGLELHLYDLAHPPQILARYAGVPQTHFHTLDVTGGLVSLLRERLGPRALADAIRQLRIPTDDLCLHYPVVSLNLLSQLPYPLLEQRGDAEPGLWGMVEALQSAHLALLREFPAALLISDIEERHYPEGSDACQAIVPTVRAEIPPLEDAARWVWHFDATGHYLPGVRVELHVVAGTLRS